MAVPPDRSTQSISHYHHVHHFFHLRQPIYVSNHRPAHRHPTSWRRAHSPFPSPSASGSTAPLPLPLPGSIRRVARQAPTAQKRLWVYILCCLACPLNRGVGETRISGRIRRRAPCFSFLAARSPVCRGTLVSYNQAMSGCEDGQIEWEALDGAVNIWPPGASDEICETTLSIGR